MIPSHADLVYTVVLFNADSAGNPLEHFSAEQAGQPKNNPPSIHGLIFPVRIHCITFLNVKKCLRSPNILLPAAAGLLHRLLYLRATSAPSAEERRAHAHRPQGAHRGAGPAGLLCSVQLRSPGQVGFWEKRWRMIKVAHCLSVRSQKLWASFVCACWNLSCGPQVFQRWCRPPCDGEPRRVYVDPSFHHFLLSVCPTECVCVAPAAFTPSLLSVETHRLHQHSAAPTGSWKQVCFFYDNFPDVLFSLRILLPVPQAMHCVRLLRRPVRLLSEGGRRMQPCQSRSYSRCMFRHSASGVFLEWGYMQSEDVWEWND